MTLFAAVVTQTAGAHQILESAIPAAGSTVGGPVEVVRLTFAEPLPATAEVSVLTIEEASVKMYGADYAAGVLQAEFEALVEPGAYLVDYSVVYPDGATDESRYLFTFDPDAVPTGLERGPKLETAWWLAGVVAVGLSWSWWWRRRLGHRAS